MGKSEHWKLSYQKQLLFYFILEKMLIRILDSHTVINVTKNLFVGKKYFQGDAIKLKGIIMIVLY